MVTLSLLLAMLAAPVAQDASPVPRDTTDVLIRREAGLPADSASGAISIVDVGHHPTDTMLSIVGNRRGAVWHVSYACAESQACAPGTDHRALAYDLSAADSAAVDRLLDALRGGADPGGQEPTPGFIGGRLTVAIDDRGFRRDYYRVGSWGSLLGSLERLMTGPARTDAR